MADRWQALLMTLIFVEFSWLIIICNADVASYVGTETVSSQPSFPNQEKSSKNKTASEAVSLSPPSDVPPSDVKDKKPDAKPAAGGGSDKVSGNSDTSKNKTASEAGSLSPPSDVPPSDVKEEKPGTKPEAPGGAAEDAGNSDPQPNVAEDNSESEEEKSAEEVEEANNGDGDEEEDKNRKPVKNVPGARGIPYDTDSSSSSFLTYFLMLIVGVVSTYIIYHNRQKLKALILEGRRSLRARRENKGGSYSKLSTKSDEFLPSAADAASARNYIY